MYVTRFGVYLRLNGIPFLLQYNTIFSILLSLELVFGYIVLQAVMSAFNVYKMVKKVL